MKKTIFSKQIVALLTLSTVLFLGFSCTPKKTGVRAVTKTPTTMGAAATNTASVQAATNQSLNYLLNTVSIPQATGAANTFAIKSEVESPSKMYIPITTTHTGNQDAGGTYTDSTTGAQLYVRSRCIGTNCEKYALLITVVKNGQSYHQMAAISYANDCQFNLETRNAQVTSLYTNIDQLLAQRSNVVALNDCAGDDSNSGGSDFTSF